MLDRSSPTAEVAEAVFAAIVAGADIPGVNRAATIMRVVFPDRDGDYRYDRKVDAALQLLRRKGAIRFNGPAQRWTVVSK